MLATACEGAVCIDTDVCIAMKLKNNAKGRKKGKGRL
jgi:hypothetical protein